MKLIIYKKINLKMRQKWLVKMKMTIIDYKELKN